MTIQEMHNVFRTLGQQQGMQLIRGILPESIDVYLNNEIMNVVMQELRNGVMNEIQSQSNYVASAMSPINALSTLFKNARYSIDSSLVGNTKKVSFYNSNNNYYVINLPYKNSGVQLDDDETEIDSLAILNVSVEYDGTSRGSAVDCRIISPDLVNITLRDWCNRADKYYPIVSVSNNQLELYVGSIGTDVKYINLRYVKHPNVVKLDSVAENCVDCDLPQHLHTDIVNGAVQRYLISVNAIQPNASRQQ